MREPAAASTELQGQYAGFVSRLTATVVDIGIITVASIVLSWAAVAMLSFAGIDVRDCPSSDKPIRAVVCHGALALAVLAGTWGPILYALFFWSTTGQTPGKAILGVRVVRLNGRPMGFVTGLRRVFGFAVSMATLGLGFLVILSDDRRQSWHDKIAGTCVIYSWKAHQGGGLFGRAPESSRSGGRTSVPARGRGAAT